MIFCPKCQSENPVHHKYCQQCGGPLPEERSPNNVPPDDYGDTSNSAHRPIDPHAAGKGKSVLETDKAQPSQDVVPSTDNRLESQDNEGLYNENDTRLAIVSTISSWLQSQAQEPPYLDKHRRYRLVSPLPAQQSAADTVELVVVDLRPEEQTDPKSPQPLPQNLPLKPTPAAEGGADLSNAPLAGAANATMSASEKTVNVSGDISGIETQNEGKEWSDGARIATPPSLDTDDSLEALEADVPSVDTESPSSPLPGDPETTPAALSSSHVIETYLKLQEQLYPSFPRLLDAWDDEGPVVVLENRAPLLVLNDVMGQPDIVIPQVLHWLHEMTELWEVLSSHRCCRSLQELDNIRVDEDHILCLKCLYFDRPDAQYTLQDLGHLWRRLFQQADKTWSDFLVRIYQDLVDGSIADLDTLRLKLETAADQIHRSTLDTPAEEEQRDSESISKMPEQESLISETANESSSAATAASTAASLEGVQDQNKVTQAPVGVSLVGVGDRATHASDDPTIILPMQLHSLSHAGLSNIGIQREHNEDFFFIDTDIKTSETPAERHYNAKGLYILCDGMGGHAAGEVASALAGETLHAYFQQHWTHGLPQKSVIYDAIVQANRQIYEQNQANDSEGCRRMGTTLAMLLLQDTKIAIAHVGDSRIYRFTRRQGLEQLTVDHEVGQREIARGVEPDVAYARPDAYQLTQALGPRDQDFIRPDIHCLEMNEDALFILGSDGLTDSRLLETYCESHIEPLISTNANLDEGAYDLIDLANQVNGHDNITVLLVRVKLRPKLSLLGR